MRRALLAVLLALTAAGCDVTPAIDIETPAFAPSIVLRAVLAAGRPPTVRLSLSGDPAVTLPDGRTASATPAGAVVTLFRDGVPAETLAPRRQTCYAAQRGACNAETGRTDVETTGPYDCSAFGGTLPIAAGATYTVRAEVPGLPPAEATVTVPLPAEVAVEDAPGSGAPRRLRVRVRDVRGAGTRFGVALFGTFSAYTTQVCRVGGPRDTLVTLAAPSPFQGRFATSDRLLLADARLPAASYPFVTFTDATFAGGEATFTLTADPAMPGNLVRADGYAVRVSVLSASLYEAYQTAAVLFGEDTPFAEPTDLPGNVVGGFGLVGAVATSEASVPPRPGFRVRSARRGA